MENQLHCELCEKSVYGDLAVADCLLGGVGIIVIHETRKRNWILCDSCNTLCCHACCERPETGYCNACINRYRLNFDDEGRLVDTE